jgi:hypothetical protein
MEKEGQLNADERRLIIKVLTGAAKKPAVCGFILRLLPRKFSRRLSDGEETPT